MGRDALVLMAKFPQPGRVKTRLGLDPQSAAALSWAFLQDLARQHDHAGYDLLLAVHPPELREELGRILGVPRTLPQTGVDLGQRLQGALREALRVHSRVVIIGSDLPTLGSEDVAAAFQALESSAVVVGPSADGGYYLLGVTRDLPLFEGIPWSTEHVFRETFERAERAGVRISLLPERNDVDLPADLDFLAVDPLLDRAPRTRAFLKARKAPRGKAGSVSVILPVMNEAASILDTLRALPSDVEKIVVDGGSTDATRDLAAREARVVTATRGRATQLNAGASLAGGDILLFLHADARLPRQGLTEIRRAIGDGCVGGGFLGRFDPDHWLFRFGYPLRDLRTRLLHEIYGDQGIFVRRDVFEALGGYRAIPIMEDYEFVQRLRRRGPLRVIPFPIRMSARRYLRTGILRQHLKNLWILFRYLAGVAPEKLSPSYERYWEVAGSGPLAGATPPLLHLKETT